ncbi:hypothetical protein [Rhodococcus sp. NCIMB 12038]|uniref:hypothetical protein n=1 Tax=Rhodococcus sp. NCIMB 12038 TaxID=933800 RepID=UPI000B3D07B3|nr:hypothetical protein [Rhodococcus sp. NCIMB 12038]OUS97224.1 hypothetical protein CA951_02445 [Rhodococcus sp. NCIMB 12038]
MDEDTSSGAPGTEPNSTGAQRHEAGMADRMRKAKEASQRSRVDNARRRAPKASVVRYSAVIISAVASLGMIVYFTGTSSAHENAMRANLSEIRELEKALADSEAGAKNVPEVEQLRPAFSSATAKAEDLAALQNGMAGLNYEVRDRSGVLAEYGGMVDEAKKFFTTGSLSGGAFLPHGQWYQPHEPGKNEKGQAAWIRVPGSSWGWQAIPTKSVDSSGNITTLWEARFIGGENDGMLLAWVSGKYDPQRGEFFDMKRGLTVEGNDRLGATTSPPEGSSEKTLVPAPNEKELIDDALRRTGTGSTSATPSATPSVRSTAPSTSATAEPPSADTQDPEMADPGLDGAN